MAKVTKSEAKKAIESYGNLLIERAVVSEIEKEEVRGEIRYKVKMAGSRPYEIVARGCMEAANVLVSMWLGYEAAYKFLM